MNPPSPVDVTEELLLASQTHLGHATSLWNPANSRYIFGVREGIHIISLDVTAAHLRRAARIVSSVSERGGIVLFVGTRKGHERMVVRAAELAGGCHLFERWIPGTITNGQQILSRSYTKVVDHFDREMEGFDKQLGELPPLKPDLVVCFNLLENWVLLHECALTGVPTVGIVDTDVNPTWVTYPIPANDDSLRSVATIAGVLGRAGQEGQHMRKLAAQNGKVTYLPPPDLQLPESEQEQVFGYEAEVSGGEKPESYQRMGKGTNFYEAGLTPSGGVLDSDVLSMNSKVEHGEDRASIETKANPGRIPSLLPERNSQPDVDMNIAANPFGAGPVSSADKPVFQRKLEQEDGFLEKGPSQVQ